MDKNSEEFKVYRKTLSYKWIIGILIGIIILICTYKLWDNGEPLQTLVSVGGSLISITLGVIAIAYSMVESIRTSNKEERINSILNQIESKVGNMNDSVIEMSKKIEAINKFDFNNFYRRVKNNTDTQEINKIVGTNHNNVITKEQNTSYPNHLKGDIFLAQLADTGKNIISGTRPVIVYQNNVLSNHTSINCVIPITSRVEDGDIIPTHVKFAFQNQNSLAVVEQIQSISSENLINLCGKVDSETLKRIDEAVRFMFDLKNRA